MTIQSFKIDPDSVSQDVFDSHKHGYRKITRIGVDRKIQWENPSFADVIDDGTVHVGEKHKIRAIGVTVSTENTGIPG